MNNQLDWQPFATVPKDGTDVLFFWPASVNNRTGSKIIALGRVQTDADGSYYKEVDGWTAGKLMDEGGTNPTHWAHIKDAGPEPRQYDLWMGGYAATGEHSPAHFMGHATGIDFADAIKDWNNRNPKNQIEKRDNGRYYGGWVQEIFDNQADARKRFG